MGRVSKSQYIEIQNPKKSPFNNMDLVWKKYVRHGKAHIIKVGGCGLKDNHGNPNHHQSIKHDCLTQISIRQLYARPEVAKIIVYHRPHTRINGEPAHGKHDLDSIVGPSFFAPQMSQALKDHIWTQLGLSYTIKHIYDKHKAIW
jgi:hypothetical protein